jgi:hypothetical protein
MSSIAKNTYGAAPGSLPCIPPGTLGGVITNPFPDVPVSNFHPKSPS